MEQSVCSADYAPAFRLLARRIVEELTATCLRDWPVAVNGEPLCQTRLEGARCAVKAVSGQEIPRCAGAPPAPIPCWRLRPDEDCRRNGDAPFRVEVMRGNNAAEPFSVECLGLPATCLTAATTACD